MADLFKVSDKELKDALSGDDYEPDLDEGNDVIYDWSTSSVKTENEEPVSSDEEPAEEENSSAETAPAPKPSFLNIDYKRIRNVFELLDGFRNSDAYRSKKNSDDGLMDSVSACVDTVQVTRDMISSAGEYDERSVASLKSAAEPLSKFAREYLRKKHPFFKKGQRRKALVEQVYHAANYMVESPEHFVLAMKNASLMSEIGTDVAEGSIEDQLAKNAERFRTATEAYSNKRGEAGEKKEELEKNGVTKDGASERQGRSAYVAFSEIGELTGDALKENVSGIQNALESSGEKAKNAQAMEKLFELFDAQNLGDFIPQRPEDIYKDGFEKKLYVTEAAMDLAEPVIEKYYAYILQGVKGLKYSKEELHTLGKKILAFQMMNTLYSNLTNLVTSPLFPKMGPGILNFIDIYSKDELTQMYYQIQEDRKRKQYTFIFFELLAVRQAMDDRGFRFGMSEQELLNSKVKEIDGTFAKVERLLGLRKESK